MMSKPISNLIDKVILRGEKADARAQEAANVLLDIIEDPKATPTKEQLVDIHEALTYTLMRLFSAREQIDILSDALADLAMAQEEEEKLNKKLDENDGSNTSKVVDLLVDAIDSPTLPDDLLPTLTETLEEVISLSEQRDDLEAVIEHLQESPHDTTN